VAAFKPSTLAIGGVGVVPLAPSFDTVGAFGASAQDAAFLAAGYAADHLRLATRPAITPRIVLLQDPLIEKLQKSSTEVQVAALAEKLGAAGLALHRASAGAGFEAMIARHRRVMLAELGTGQCSRHFRLTLICRRRSSMSPWWVATFVSMPRWL
jgi:Asp-tRNA(Asn)/Glu-tRNA(Gln) amidotransferase A subunit family amidase